jgi:hypothetical protein
MAIHPRSPVQLCERLKQLGYARQKTIRLYGEIFELQSDPLPEGQDFVVHARSTKTYHVRAVKIPRFIVQSANAA